MDAVHCQCALDDAAGHAWVARFAKDRANRSWTTWSLRDDRLISFGARSGAVALKSSQTLRQEFDHGAEALER